MFRQAEKNGIIKKNPVALATQPREKQKKERRVLSAEEQKIFLKYANVHLLKKIVGLFQ